jgi:CDP-glucose 4,6-dehydratase
MFGSVYQNKKVLITGNTGFKGSWLTSWLLKLGANVIGISKDIPTTPSMFETLELSKKIDYYQEDLRNLSKINKIIASEKPDFIFHLAAQPIVSLSYEDPIETISSNVMGTSNILESLKNINHKCVAVIITSDKAYENIEQVWGYKENDPMGGKDPYSASKGAAELIIKSYFFSFFNKSYSNIRMGIGRAGNVIGGGDWAKDRIVVDCIQSWSENKSVEIRNPSATRPWQHVLEPISGYLRLGQNLFKSDLLNGEAFNFGPKSDQNQTVKQLLTDLSRYWNFEDVNQAFFLNEEKLFHEAGLLKLNCDKANAMLNWQPCLEYRDNIRLTSEWYFDYYITQIDMFKKTQDQLAQYELLAEGKGFEWTE